MSIRAGSSVSADSLTPYAVNRRKGLKEDTHQRRKRRNRGEDNPACRLKATSGVLEEREILSAIDSAEADAAVRKVEQDLQAAPSIAHEAQTTHRETVRKILSS